MGVASGAGGAHQAPAPRCCRADLRRGAGSNFWLGATRRAVQLGTAFRGWVRRRAAELLSAALRYCPPCPIYNEGHVQPPRVATPAALGGCFVASPQVRACAGLILRRAVDFVLHRRALRARSENPLHTPGHRPFRGIPVSGFPRHHPPKHRAYRRCSVLPKTTLETAND